MSSRYDVPVDPDAPNNAHAFALRMVGWNRRVLELGAARGHVTRALVAQNNRVTAVEFDPDAAPGLKTVAEEVVIGDLNAPETLSGVSGPFDVVLAGDVLEHLLNPDDVLLRATGLLAPGGRVVVSLPNIAHADVRLSLLSGRFEYNEWGLLDSTHIRFFTHKTLQDLVKRAGLVITEMQRVRVPAFESELRVSRQSVPTAVVNEILKDPEAETYQFVFTAVRDDGDERLTTLARQYTELRDAHDALLIAHKATELKLRNTQRRAAKVEERLATTRAQLRSLRSSRAVRYTSPARKILTSLRGAGQ
jgi:2-polyprenyl-3-methyl-5-hydroxy-6-metoxy-1,4-benzoquinol methylase